jgi:RimJ/RimL family protein N-acetyltransferase
MPQLITTERLQLVRWGVEHVDDMLDAIRSSFDELHQWMHWAAQSPVREELIEVITNGRARFDAGEEFEYVLIELDTAELVGATGVRRRETPEILEIGYWVRSDRVGRGYVTEAVRALSDVVVDSTLDFSWMEIRMDRANERSAAVARRLGYRLDGVTAREKIAPAHTGYGYVWSTDRARWRGTATSA